MARAAERRRNPRPLKPTRTHRIRSALLLVLLTAILGLLAAAALGAAVFAIVVLIQGRLHH